MTSPCAALDRTSFARELADSLDALRSALGELTALALEKLAALRAADLAALETCAQREAEPLARARRLAEQQQAMLADAAQALPLAPPAAALAHELAEQFDEPARSQILSKIEGLRASALRLREKNDRLARVARGLLGHVRAVFSDVACAHQEAVVYGAGGRLSPHTKEFWVDALG